MAATKTQKTEKAVNMEEKFDSDLDLHLRKIINSNHTFVNPTLKRLAELCKVRLHKLETREILAK